MVDVANLERARMLSLEITNIEAAIRQLEDGEKILSLVVGPPTGAVSIPTGYMQFPPQMVEAIKTYAHGRLDAISEELVKMGVTGAASGR
jgi:hypothetical protein